jgi:hypothetical protein
MSINLVSFWCTSLDPYENSAWQLFCRLSKSNGRKIFKLQFYSISSLVFPCLIDFILNSVLINLTPLNAVISGKFDLKLCATVRRMCGYTSFVNSIKIMSEKSNKQSLLDLTYKSWTKTNGFLMKSSSSHSYNEFWRVNIE